MRIQREELQKLKMDWERRFRKYPDKPFLWRLHYYWSHWQYRTILLFRLWKAYASLPLIGCFLERAYRRASLHSGLEILTSPGGGVIVPHFGSIKLNAEKIGENLCVFHNVTVANDYVTGRPTIGNNVFISTQCVLMGKITIGDNVVIGAHSLVINDIPSNSLAAGNPATVKKQINPDYIQSVLLKY